MDLIHTDVYTMQYRTVGGALYFVTFIDDNSRKVWGFSLKTKDQVLEAFKELHARLARETRRKLKAIRADNGGEYRGSFENCCKLHGTQLEKIVPKTPQQNGVAERMNRTIEERINVCFLILSYLSRFGERL